MAADTKTYLYLDPGRLLERAPWMWDPNIGLGTVTHQNIGYLFPMGPWYWIFEQLGAPDWVAQRLWLGTVLFAAGAGVLFLLRTSVARRRRARAPRRRRPLAGRRVRAGRRWRLHALALRPRERRPDLGAPAAVGGPAVARRAHPARRATGSWRHPAAFALVVTVVGGVNATALVLAGHRPAAVGALRRLGPPRGRPSPALATVVRIGVLTLGCSLWWIAGLAVQGSYGIEILRYTETVKTVAAAGAGLGGAAGPRLLVLLRRRQARAVDRASGRYMQSSLWLIAVSFALPTLAVLAAVMTLALPALLRGPDGGRHGGRGRRLPLRRPVAVRGAVQGRADASTAGWPCAVDRPGGPLVASAWPCCWPPGSAPSRPACPGGRRHRARRRPPPWPSCPAVDGDAIGHNLQRPEDIPDYWEEAAAYLDTRDDGTRVLEIPGSDFASYRWGTPSTPSRRGSWTGPTWPASSSPTARRRRPTC